MDMELERVTNKHRTLEEKIREAEEGCARGDPGAREWLGELKRAQNERSKEERQASDRDYLKRRGRDREMRNKFDKMIDAMHGEL